MRFTLYRAWPGERLSDSRVSVSLGSGSENRGTERLLRDCALVGRMLGTERAPARRRLEQKLGERFARQLVLGLRRRPLENGR